VVWEVEDMIDLLETDYAKKDDSNWTTTHSLVVVQFEK